MVIMVVAADVVGRLMIASFGLLFLALGMPQEVWAFSPTPLAIRSSSGHDTNRNHKRRRHGFLNTVLTSERDVTKTATSTAPFDYRKIPPISDTTPCEIIPLENDANNNNNEDFFFPSPEELSSLPKGDQGGYHIVRQYTVVGSDDYSSANANFTLQYALTVLDPENYPTLSRVLEGSELVD